jgi:hypothetical protein
MESGQLPCNHKARLEQFTTFFKKRVFEMKLFQPERWMIVFGRIA